MEVLTAIKQIIDERKENKLSPHTACVLKARRIAGIDEKEFNKQARTLLDENKIKLIRTINGFSIELKNGI